MKKAKTSNIMELDGDHENEIIEIKRRGTER